MRWILVILAATALSVSGSLAAPKAELAAPVPGARETAAPHGDTIWVANRDANTLTVFEAATGLAVKTVPMGRGAHDVAISTLAGKVYVTNELENRIAVVSASTVSVIRTIAVPRPHHAKVSADGRTLYVGLFDNNQIAVIDTATDSVRVFTTSNNVNAKAHAPRASFGGGFIFVPHEIGDEVTALDAASGNLVGGVNAGSMPTEVLAAADGRRLFVSMRGEGRIKVFDLATARETGSVAVGTQPESLILSEDQRTLVASLRGSPASLAFVDATALTFFGTVPLAGAGTFGDLAVLSANGRYVYATFDAGANGTGGVAVVDIRNGQRLGSWLYTSTGRPHGIGYSTTPVDVP